MMMIMWNMGMSGVRVRSQMFLRLPPHVLGLLAMDILQMPLPLVARSGIPAQPLEKPGDASEERPGLSAPETAADLRSAQRAIQASAVVLMGLPVMAAEA
jgi:hypothetical protein